MFAKEIVKKKKFKPNLPSEKIVYRIWSARKVTNEFDKNNNHQNAYAQMTTYQKWKGESKTK